MTDPSTPLKLMLFGAGSLSLPATLLAVAHDRLSGQDAAAIMAGVPIVVLLVAHVLAVEQKDLGAALLPVLAALGGAMLLLPVNLPTTLDGWTGVVLDLAAAVLVGTCSVYANRTAAGVPLRSSFRWVCLGNSALYGIVAVLMWALCHKGPEGVRNVRQGDWIISLLAICCSQALAFVLLAQLQPLRFATRFLVVPSIATLEGFLLWRPALSFRDGVGAALIIGSVGVIFRLEPSDDSVAMFRSTR